MSREYSFVKSKAEYLNRYVCDFLDTLDGTIEVKFVTDSRYKQSEGGNTMNKFDVDRSTKTGDRLSNHTVLGVAHLIPNKPSNIGEGRGAA